MSVKKILGSVLLVFGILDILKFGLTILTRSPILVLGIALAVAGAALLVSDRNDRLLRP
jgi:uncharacterized membrane protein HdeD (DUF308 family)